MCTVIPTRAATAVAAILVPILLLLASTAGATRFVDISQAAGLQRVLKRPRLKYGGAAVADLDGDGFPDLLFGHHDDRHAEVYFNNRDGTFSRNDWAEWIDLHGITPFRRSPSDKRMHFLFLRGGADGSRPNRPLIMRVMASRRIEKLEPHELGLETAFTRGRSAVFMQLRDASVSHVPDLVLLNAPPTDGSPPQKCYTASSSMYQRVRMGAFDRLKAPYGTALDVDNDGRVELITFHNLHVWRVVAGIQFRDISEHVLPRSLLRNGVAAVAELDFDNDGRMDLYIARASVGELSWLAGRTPHVHDYLLRNVGGRYVDVSVRARIPRGTQSRGVTVGDFDNDGLVDILINRYDAPDLLLRNTGHGTFSASSAGFARQRGVPGDMSTAVDLDRDGRLDVVLSEGDFFDKAKTGYYRIMRNVGAVRHYLLVRVGSSPRRGATSLHAVVRVRAGKRQMMRRVGTPGTAVSVSYIELVHFGLGDVATVQSVSVWWTDGAVLTKYDVKANALYTMGSV